MEGSLLKGGNRCPRKGVSRDLCLDRSFSLKRLLVLHYREEVGVGRVNSRGCSIDAATTFNTVAATMVQSSHPKLPRRTFAMIRQTTERPARPQKIAVRSVPLSGYELMGKSHIVYEIFCVAVGVTGQIVSLRVRTDVGALSASFTEHAPSTHAPISSNSGWLAHIHANSSIPHVDSDINVNKQVA